MRRVAEAVGVWPTALYHHVGDKQGLVALVLDDALARLQVPAGEVPWQDWLRALAGSMREILHETPGLAGELLDNQNYSPPALALTERALRVLCDGGLTPDQAADAFLNFFLYVIGRVRREEQFALHRAEGRDRLAEVVRQPDRALPLFRQAAEGWLGRSEEDIAAEGLELLIAGIETRYLSG